MARKSPGVFRLPNGMYRAQVAYTVCVVVDGQSVKRRRYLSADRATPTEARIARLQLLAKRDAGMAGVQRETVHAYLHWWLDTMVPQRGIRSGSVRDYHQCLNRVVAVIGHRYLDELTISDGDALLAAFRAEGLAPRTIRRTMQKLSMAFHDAIDRKKLAAHPFPRLTLPRLQKHEPIALTLAQVDDVRAALQAHRWALIYDLYLFTGMRSGEALGMQWKNLDWSRGAYHLTHDLDPKTLQIDPLKTDKARRTIMLPSDHLHRLRQHYEEQRRLAAQHGNDWNPIGLIFCTRNGTPIQANNLWKAFKRVVRDLNLPPTTTIQSLRHTFRHHAADYLPPHVVQAWLGHSDISTTFDTYGSGASERAKRAAAQFLDVLYLNEQQD